MTTSIRSKAQKITYKNTVKEIQRAFVKIKDIGKKLSIKNLKIALKIYKNKKKRPALLSGNLILTL